MAEDIVASMERYNQRQAAEALELMARAKAQQERWMQRVSPLGALGLPPLLDERRVKYGVPDVAFKHKPLFDLVLVHQVPLQEVEGEFYGDTSILMPEQTKQREKNEAPRGLIIGAGLGALDVLRAHGSDVGHIILFVSATPWRLPIEVFEGRWHYLIPLRVGNIISDEDRRTDITTTVVDGYVQHRFDGATGLPAPRMPGDF